MTAKPSLLIVDDDELIVETLGMLLSDEFDISTAPTRQAAIQVVRTMPQAPELALIDLGLPPSPHRPDEGFALIADLLAHAPDMRIIVLSGQSDTANARRARTLGALEFVAKPAEPSLLKRILRQALRTEPQANTPSIIGDSPAVASVRARILQYADTPFPVLIQGESGAGKERVAEQLHATSRRNKAPFLTINCAAIAPTLIEAALFGHTRGAFTGAASPRSGYFEEASEGSLLLDEIGELPLDLQPKLLRVLENGEYQRVGETRPQFSNARVLAATNRDLAAEVRAGRFRGDLYHRLSVFTLHVPPLRDMGDDRLVLYRHFRDLFARQTGHAPFELSDEAVQLWRSYDFPGNVRELKNICIRLQTKYPAQPVSAAQLEDELDRRNHRASAPVRTAQPPAAHAPRPMELAMAQLSRDEDFSLDDALREQERTYIEAAIRLSGGNISQAARVLGINRTTLYNRMDNLGMPRQASTLQRHDA